MKLSKTLPFAILSMAVVALVGCKNEFDGYEFYKLIDEVPATCTMGGMKAHYESKPNDKGDTIYLNVDKKKVDKEDLIIPATGHNMTFHKEVYSTCTEEGTIAHYHCENCGLNFEDEAGKTLVDDLHKSTKGHIMDNVWTPSPDGTHHYHKCAREGCDHIEDEELCICDKEVIKDEFKVEGEDNTYYKSCVCGRKGTETFKVKPQEVVDVDEEGYEAKIRQVANLDEYDPTTDTRISLSNIGVNAPDYITIPNSSLGEHIFGTYDYMPVDGIDLIYNYKFSKIEGVTPYTTIYLGNQSNEDGLQFRIMANRDDGYVEGYFFSTNGGLVNEDNTPFYNQPTSSCLFMTKPGKMDDGYKVEIKLTPISEISNADYDFFKVQFFVNDYEFKKSEADASPIDLKVGFPSDYFYDEEGNYRHNKVRISSSTENKGINPNAQIKEFKFPPQLILMDENGWGCIGATDDPENVRLPNLSKDGHKFVGYYDDRGVPFDSKIVVDSKFIVYPRFIEIDESSNVKNLTLSDLDLLRPGLENYTTNNLIANGLEEGFRRVPVDANTTSVRISFVANFKFARERGGKTVDDYFQFGLPYDYKDNQTRFVFRINAHSGVNFLEGYFGHPSTSLGEHGREGTKYEMKDFSLNEISSYLITLGYEQSQYHGLRYSLKIRDLSGFNEGEISFDGVDFINSTDFSFSNPYRNYFSVIRSRADADLTMKNAW